ncbi:MCE family protein [Polymorphobacter sp. PAMC 29334]|uniref:MlaD family protein n=1 Tax=Polymorphobacter sp. PAMC 29334 TaxID=2862331 RepID=UPI001C78D85B|nr:MlaD family protein [Polymorphobacter sp. PAMC 29334]QYE34873.1 MCE family protein [Polymorphobacter sp. PAMC 29334]
METRSNYALVGGVVIALTVALFVFVLYLAKFSGTDKRQFDIFFRQSISGIAIGSPVQFKGVPVGQIKEIALLPKTPDAVRVRIEVGTDVPILQGTTAAIEGVGFTGVSQIQLTGAMAGAPPITEIGPFGRPVIPPRAGPLGQLLASAPELLNNVSALTASLNELLNPANRKSLGNILANTDRLTGSLADRGPEIAATIVETRATLKQATDAAAALTRLTGHADTILTTDAGPLVHDLRETAGHANATLQKLDGLVASAQPGVDTLTNQTLPETAQLIREARDATAQLGAIAAKLDEDPAGALLGGRKLPEYAAPGYVPPKKGKK